MSDELIIIFHHHPSIDRSIICQQIAACRWFYNCQLLFKFILGLTQDPKLILNQISKIRTLVSVPYLHTLAYRIELRAAVKQQSSNVCITRTRSSFIHFNEQESIELKSRTISISATYNPIPFIIKIKYKVEL